MDLEPLSGHFVAANLHLAWGEVEWGFRQGLIGWRGVVEIAQTRPPGPVDESPADAAVELAACGKDEAHRIGELLDRLKCDDATDRGTSDTLARRKWLYLVLLDLRARADRPDVLDRIDAVYAEFDYPEDVEPFVSYMPPTDGYDPASHTPSENRVRLLAKWDEFLQRARHEFTDDHPET